MGRQSPGTKMARATRSAAEIIKDREEAVGLMNTALKRKFNQIERKMADARTDTLRYYHDVGKLCVEIQDDTATYDRGAFRLIERALATQARTLRKAANFARAYNDEQLTELLGLLNEQANFRLHWGHMSFLLTLKEADKRLMWAKRAVKNLWPPEELHHRMVLHYGNKADTPHGRHHELPATIPGQIRQIRTETDKWLAKQRTAWNGERINAFGNILTAPPDMWTPEMVDDLRVTRSAMEGVVQEARENITRLDRIIQHAEQCLEQQAQQSAAAEAAAVRAGKEARVIDLNTRPVRRTPAAVS